MSDIYRCDQMVSYYSSSKKAARWYKKILFHLLDLTTWNSYFISRKKYDNTDLSYKIFCDQLTKNLIGLPLKTTAIELFKLKKQINEAPEDNHYAEKIPKPTNYKRHTYFKECIF